MKKQFTEFLARIGLITVNASNTLEDANNAYAKGNFKLAIRLFNPLALNGNCEAQNTLGYMYDNGEGVRQDYIAAIKLFNLAAAQGNLKAQFNLGIMYEKGRGVAQDYDEATKWYELAAAQGDEDAKSKLAEICEIRKSVQQDNVTAQSNIVKVTEGGIVNDMANIIAFIFSAFIIYIFAIVIFGGNFAANQARFTETTKADSALKFAVELIYDEYPITQIRYDYSVRVYIKKKDFLKIPFPNRDDTQKFVSNAWCNADAIKSNWYFLPTVQIRDIVNDDVLATSFCMFN